MPGPGLKRSLPYLALLALGFGAFYYVPQFEYVNWDDNLYVTNNPCVQDPGTCTLTQHLLTPYLGYPAPLTILSYQLEALFFGHNPHVTHVINLVLHILTSILLYVLLQKVLKNKALSLIGASLFLVHPITAEVVSWASARKEILCTLFSLLALFVWFGQGERLKGLVIALLLWLLALASKPTAVALFLVFPVTDLLQHRLNRKRAALYSIALIIAVADTLLAFHFESRMHAIHSNFSALARIQEVTLSAFEHARLFVALSHYPKYLEPAAPQWWKPAIGAAVILAFLWVLWQAVKRKSPLAPWWLAAILLYLPVSGIIPLSRRFADSYCYPVLPFLLISSMILLSKARLMRFIALLLLLAVPVSAMVTLKETAKWKNGVTLWSTMYRVYPDSPQVCRNLGNAFIFGPKPRPDKAITVYETCIRTLGNPDFYARNLGIALIMANRSNQAKQVFKAYLLHHPGDSKSLKYLKIISTYQNGQPPGQSPDH